MRLLISPESRFGCVDSPPRRKGPCLPAGADSPTPLAASSSPLPGPCAFSESLCAPRSDASFGANRGGLSSGPLKAQVHVRSPEGPRARRRLHMRSGHAPGRGHPPPPSCSEQPLRSARVKSSQCSVSESPSHGARGGDAGIQTRAPYSKAGAAFTISHPCNGHGDGTTTARRPGLGATARGTRTSHPGRRFWR